MGLPLFSVPGIVRPQLLTAEPELARKLKQLTSIPGIGLTIAIVVVAETSGFVLVENERQLASYAGLNVVQHQSGLSAHGTRITKRGNVRLRTAIYPGPKQFATQSPTDGLLRPSTHPASQRQAWRH